MPFQPGNKLAHQRKKLSGGPKPRAEREKDETAAQILRREIEANVRLIARRYVKQTFKNDRVLCHAIDKLLPDDHVTTQPIAINYQFVQFGANAPSHKNSAQLSAEELSGAILVGDDRTGQEESGHDLASPFGERQNSVEFCSFANVPRERG